MLTVTEDDRCPGGRSGDDTDCAIGGEDRLLRVSEDVLVPFYEGARPVPWTRQ